MYGSKENYWAAQVEKDLEELIIALTNWVNVSRIFKNFVQKTSEQIGFQIFTEQDNFTQGSEVYKI